MFVQIAIVSVLTIVSTSFVSFKFRATEVFLPRPTQFGAIRGK